MTEEERQIFREGSLSDLSTPERLDQLLRIVRPQSWLLVLAIGGGLALAGVWAVFGRIPATAKGTAILVRPKQVVPLQSPAAGPLEAFEVAVGETVAKGQLLARLRLPALVMELEQERAKLALFESRTRELTGLELELAEGERESIRAQRALLEQRIVNLEQGAKRYRDKNASYLAEQRENVEKARSLSLELGKALEARFEKHETLAAEKISTQDALVEPQSDLIDNQLRLAELDVRGQEVDLREILAQEEYDSQLDLIQELRLRLEDLELKEMTITRHLRENELSSSSEREAIARRIDELQSRLERESRVVSPHAGRILEFTASPGEHVTLGLRLGKMEIEDPSAALMAIAYFQIRDGKKIAPDAAIRITPTTVERERFGSMKGSVRTVSTYPVTTEAAANQIGDLETARSLLGGMTRIEITADLATSGETFTGFEWTSGKGPDDVLVTPGTTADVRVTIEEIRPITLILPFLKTILGA